MLKLMLDEMISPALVAPLWEQEIDTVHVRDRDMLQTDDHVIWEYATREMRALVTINRSHFMRLAKGSIFHPGVIAIPNGGSREEQYDYVMNAVAWASTSNQPQSAFMNRFVDVSVTHDIQFDEVTVLTEATPYNQNYLC
jgi:predicted nuclease of predicted toxin-antitoxin system